MKNNYNYNYKKNKTRKYSYKYYERNALTNNEKDKLNECLKRLFFFDQERVVESPYRAGDWNYVGESYFHGIEIIATIDPYNNILFFKEMSDDKKIKIITRLKNRIKKIFVD